MSDLDKLNQEIERKQEPVSEREITINTWCPHQKRFLNVSNNPYKNECHRCLRRVDNPNNTVA